MIRSRTISIATAFAAGLVVPLVGIGTMVPAAASAPPLPENCTFAKGNTTCVEQTATTEPGGPQDGQVCLTADTLPGTIHQEIITTTTITRIYKGRGTSGPLLRTSTSTTTEPGPATCEASPVSAAWIVLVPDDERDAFCAAQQLTFCFRVVASGLEPGSELFQQFTLGGVEQGPYHGGQASGTGTVDSDGSAYCGNPPPYTSLTNLYFTGTGANGEPVQSNSLDPCPPLA